MKMQKKAQIEKTKSPEKDEHVNLTIRPYDSHEVSKDEAAELAALAELHHSQRSPERLRRNAMLAVRYRMERYIGDETISFENICTTKDFVNEFLNVLGLRKSAFAAFIDIDQSNLNKYYRAERRFSTELALKFSHFFHTSAELWLQVELKNELLELQKEIASDKYSKYDYEKVLQLA